ncbi:MAG TPA: hypothetical protein VF221_18235, partial [Chloroflexota bacterium]
PAVGMHVGHHLQPGLAAMLPERTVTRSVEHHNAAIQAVRIEVIVADETAYRPAIANALAQQERAAFPMSPSAARKFVEEGAP